MRRPLLIRLSLLPVLALLAAPAAAQNRGRGRPAPPPQEPLPLPEGWNKTLRWRSIGPANMGGRITDIAVSAKDSSTWWAATASGGLIKTVNNGISFEHQFDREKTSAVGAVAVAASNPDIVWVGSGEANPRNSVTWGDGVYKSVDGGKTWKNMGLRRSFQIGALAIHPANPDIVYVGVLGRLWGPSPERGLYKTADGGETWQRILYVDDKTGVIDVQMNPAEPDTLLVASYERQRDGFDTNDPVKKIAPGSALWKTQDGGRSWRKLTRGLPTSTLGRIGLDYYRKNPQVVFALVECADIGKEPTDAAYAGLNGENAEVGARLTRVVEGGPAARSGLKQGDIITGVDGRPVTSFRDLQGAIGRSKAGAKVRVKLRRNREPLELDLTFGKRPRQGRGNANTRGLGTRLGGQQANAQDRQGADGWKYGGLYRSADGGESWTRINSINPRPMYFSEVRVDPSDERFLYVLGVSTSFSTDGGKTFKTTRGVHADSHALWVDPRDGRHLILGTDGGLYVTHDRMKLWDHLNHVAIGQFYDVGVGPRPDYRVYGGLQDNGSWGGPSRSPAGGIINSDWFRIGGGDGFVVWVDPQDPDQIYYESQNGNMGRVNLRTGERGSIRPRAPRRPGQGRAPRGQGRQDRGQRPQGQRPPQASRPRFNWNTPFQLSAHNSQVFYCVGDKVYRSVSKGDRLRAISPEITRTRRGSGTAVAESPLDERVLYAGTDDGAFFMTRDSGANWTDLLEGLKEQAPRAKAPRTRYFYQLNDGEAAPRDKLSRLLPGPRWVSSIVASRFEAGRAYVTFDGHRSDDDAPYLFASEDFGATWQSIRGQLPTEAGSAKVIAEDRVNPNLLYLGCEFSAWVSLDRGLSWSRLGGNLPTVAVHDFAQPAGASELVAATHGRSLWVLDVHSLRQFKAPALNAAAQLFAPAEAIIWRSVPSRGGTNRRFVGDNPPTGAVLDYALKTPATEGRLRILDAAGATMAELGFKKEAGLHRLVWNLRRTQTRASIERRFGDRLADMEPARRKETIDRLMRRGRGPRIAAGTYQVELVVDGQTSRRPLKVSLDPNQSGAAWVRAEDDAALLLELTADEEEEQEGDGESDLR